MSAAFWQYRLNNEIDFRVTRSALLEIARQKGIKISDGNRGDQLTYSLRSGRSLLHPDVRATAPDGYIWIVDLGYRFRLIQAPTLIPNDSILPIRVPFPHGDSNSSHPDNEAGLLCQLSFSIIMEMLIGQPVKSLGFGSKKTVEGFGQVEVDYLAETVTKDTVIAIQGKRGRETLSISQIAADFLYCNQEYPGRPIRAFGIRFLTEGNRMKLAILEVEKVSDTKFTLKDEYHFMYSHPSEMRLFGSQIQRAFHPVNLALVA